MIGIVLLLVALVCLLHRPLSHDNCSVLFPISGPALLSCRFGLPSHLFRISTVQAIWMYGCNPVQRWRFRHIPGPRPLWMLGNAIEMRRKMAHMAYEDYKAIYGPMFRIFIGMQPFVVISGR